MHESGAVHDALVHRHISLTAGGEVMIVRPIHERVGSAWVFLCGSAHHALDNSMAGLGVGAMGVQHNTRYGAGMRGISALQQARYSTARLVRGGSGASMCWIMPK